MSWYIISKLGNFIADASLWNNYAHFILFVSDNLIKNLKSSKLLKEYESNNQYNSNIIHYFYYETGHNSISTLMQSTKNIFLPNIHLVFLAFPNAPYLTWDILQNTRYLSQHRVQTRLFSQTVCHIAVVRHMLASRRDSRRKDDIDTD